jgi:S1-C subfamily serine protease
LVLDGSFVLTNEHVSSDGRCTLTVGLTESLSSEPSGDLNAIVVARSAEDDLAVLRLVDSDGNPITPAGHKPVSINYLQPPLGSRLTTLGYPALGTFDTGMTITFTSGDFSGIDNTFGEFYKTTAQMRGGVSGGAAFTDDGQFIGVPTAGFIDEVTGEDVGINLIRPAKYAKPLLEEAQKSPLDPVPLDDSDSESSSGGYDSSGTDPRFGACKEAKANGYGPYYMGIDPEYDWYRDADSDGVVCE